MFSRTIKPVVTIHMGAKSFSYTPQRCYKVAVIGAAGGIGQPLSLLLKLNALITELALFDVAKVVPGVGKDLSHVDTCTKVVGHTGPCGLACAVRDADVVVITAGVPRKPGMTRDDLFKTNASIIHDVTKVIAKESPKSIIAIVTNPVNSMVPIASEVMKNACAYDSRRILGVTTLDVVRTRTFLGEMNCIDPQQISVSVIGGHSGVTIIPLISQAKPAMNMKNLSLIVDLTKRIQEAGTEVVRAKAGGGSATLAMAYSAAMFLLSVLKGLAGETNVVECAYVRSDVTQASYFANPVVLGKYGIECNLGYRCLSTYEQHLLTEAMPVLLKNIQTGEAFVQKYIFHVNPVAAYS